MTAISAREVGTTGVKVTILGHLFAQLFPGASKSLSLDVRSAGARQQRKR